MKALSHLKYAMPVLAVALAPLPASASSVRIYITNSAGDSVHVIDPATNKVVQEIKNVVGAHGVNFSPDGARVYISNEETNTLDVYDRKTVKLIKKVELSDPQQHRGDQEWRPHRGRGGARQGRARHRRRQYADAEKDHLDQRRTAAQRLRHAGQP